jgi:hypothetical protein
VNFTEVGTAAKQKRFLNALRYLQLVPHIGLSGGFGHN